MRDVEQRATDAYQSTFGEEPEVVASAPGRVNLIGEHTDYNGGFVLPCAIDLRVAAALGRGEGGLYSADFQEWSSADEPDRGSWTAYPRGVTWALSRGGDKLPGYQGAFAGDVPRASGLSSSAAIEACTALALDALFGLGISRRELAVLCQRAENEYVGVNSGIMDQYASLLCQAGAALLIDCRSLEAESVPLDLDAARLVLLICDTRVERGLAQTGYNERREACDRAARLLGVESLRDATLADLERLSGEELKRARHVVTENARVLDAVRALQLQDYVTFGRLMYASHASLRDDYEVSTAELDAFVEVARQVGALGARLTGAGFGGSAIALIEEDRANALSRQARDLFARRGFAEPGFHRFHPSAGAEMAE